MSVAAAPGLLELDEAAARTTAASFNINQLDRGFFENPYPVYHALRRFDPVHRNADGTWFIARYDDALVCYRDRRMSSDKKVEFRKMGDGPLYKHHTTSLVFNDPPLHTRVRKLLATAFTPRAIAAMEPRLIATVEGLLDGMDGKGRVDFLSDFASPLPLEVAELGAQRFGTPVIQGYGMTETSPLTNATPLGMSKEGSVGPAVPDTLEKIVDLDTGEELPAGGVGELLISGPQVMQGYWKAPEATAETIRPDGWLRSGDIARFDEDGYVYIVDRVKEMIKYKGYQVAPAELEGVVMEHPAVLDAAVIPKRDFEAGEIPKAFVVLKDGQQASADELMGFVAERVAPYKKLRELEFVASIPKTLSGKILRRDLIEQERAKAKT